MLFIYNQLQNAGLKLEESGEKASLYLTIGGKDKYLIGSTTEPEIKEELKVKAADKASITSRLKRVFITVKGKRLVLDITNKEFVFIDGEKKDRGFTFAQSAIIMVTEAGVSVDVKKTNFLEVQSLEQKESAAVLHVLYPRWRAWSELEEKVIIDLKKDSKLFNSFELGYIEDDKKIKTNSLQYRKVEAARKDKTAPKKDFKPKKPYQGKKFDSNKQFKPSYKKDGAVGGTNTSKKEFGTSRPYQGKKPDGKPAYNKDTNPNQITTKPAFATRSIELRETGNYSVKPSKPKKGNWDNKNNRQKSTYNPNGGKQKFAQKDKSDKYGKPRY